MSGITKTLIVSLGLALMSSAIAEAKIMSPATVVTSGKQKLLTDADGRSLYTFDKDQPGKSECTLLCALAWPPFEAPAGAKASGPWSVVTRPTGVTQWAYNGSPLYTYHFDSKPGDIHGDGAEGVWHIAKP
jgi:predicted lipoprotein with Yx(FWY)xxD motif